LLAPERRAKNPSSSDIINGFSLDNDDSYNELQSDSSESNNTANGRNKDLSAIIMPVFEYGSESPSGAKLSPSLAKSLANGLDLTVSATKTTFP
jgi:hypothetical protein